jgi:hypothetical protein
MLNARNQDERTQTPNTAHRNSENASFHWKGQAELLSWTSVIKASVGAA